MYHPGSPFCRPSKLAPHRKSPLRTDRDHRLAHRRGDRRRPRFQQPRLAIHQRPFAPDDRAEAGAWEGDLIVGKDQRSVIGTLVERETRYLRLLHLPARDGDTLHAALVDRMADLPKGLLRSITWDQGQEMARHLEISQPLGIPVYFCDSHTPWQRGSNENANGLLRDYFPKGTDLSTRPRSTFSRSRTSSTGAPDSPRRPDTPRAVHRPATVQEPASVATMTGNRPAENPAGFTRR